MSTPTWWQEWHGEPFPVSTATGGSTQASTGVIAALSSKVETGTYTAAIGALGAQISTKASGAHGHVLADCAGLESTLAGLAAQVSTKAAGTHSHATNEVSSLASTLAGLAAAISTKAAGSHTHPLADVTGLDSTLAALSATISTKASLASGLVPAAQLGSSVADQTVFLRGDRVWAAPTAVVAGVVPSTWVVASTHTLTGSTTMQSAAGLSFALSSAAVYRFEFIVAWQTISSATGLALGVNGPAGINPLVYEVSVSSGFGPTVTKAGRAFGVQTIATPGSSAANLNEYGYLGGIVRTLATAGTLQLQFATEVAGSTVSIRGGSLGVLQGPL